MSSTIGNKSIHLNGKFSLQDLAVLIRENAGEYFKRECSITSAKDTKEFLINALAFEEREHFGVMFLDNRHQLIKFEVLFSGTIDGSSVYPREVVKRALELNTNAVIFSHNHPSGDTAPSQADKTITEKLKNALNQIDIRVLDHIIVGDGCYSFAEAGLL